MKKRDIILVLVLSAVFGAMYFFGSHNGDKEGKTVGIYANGDKISDFNIEKSGTYAFYISETGEAKLEDAHSFDAELHPNFNIFTLEGGEVRIIEAGCPDELCKKTGSIHNVGELIVCLPHRFYIKIEGAPDGGGLDGIAQ